MVAVANKRGTSEKPTVSDSLTACAQLCALVKSEFDACLRKERILTRAKTFIEQEKSENKDRGMESSDESSARTEDDSQETFAERHEKLEQHQFRVDRGLTPCLQVDLGGNPVMCINTQKRVILAVDTQVVSFVSTWLIPLARQTALSLTFNKCGRKGSILPPKRNASNGREGSQTSDAPSGFGFTQNMTPNI